MDEDQLKNLTELGLSCAGLGTAVSIFNIFNKKSGPTLFSADQVKQLTTIFQQVFAHEEYITDVTDFTSYSENLRAYINNPSHGGLSTIGDNLNEIGNRIALHGGYKATKIYLAAASLYLTALSLEHDVAAATDKAGAQLNIGEAAQDILNNLITLEHQLFAELGAEPFSLLKQFSLFNIGNPLDPNLESWFGSSYRKHVIKLIELVNTCTPDKVASIQVPQYALKFFQYNPDIHQLVWDGRNRSRNNEVGPPGFFYQCNQNPSDKNYLALGDLFFREYAPTNVPYITGYSKPLSTQTGAVAYTQVWNDAGSTCSDDYSAYRITQDGPQIGTYNGIGGNRQPDAVRFALLDQDSVELVPAPDDGSDFNIFAHANCIIVSHHQWGGWGIYNLYSNLRRPDNLTVYQLKIDKLEGHPVLDAVTNGTLAQIPSGVVFVMIGGVLRGFTNMGLENNLFIINVRVNLIDTTDPYTVGENILTSYLGRRSDGCIFVVLNDAVMYGITSMEVFNRCGFDMSKVENNIDEKLAAIPVEGVPIW